MTVRPRTRRLASVALAAGLALATLAGLTGCGASNATEVPAQYTAKPAEAPTLDLKVKPGTRYAVAEFKQGE